MASDRKRQRQLEATKARLKKVYSLSFGLLRSDASHEKFREEWLALQSSGQTLEQMKVSVIPAVEQVQNNAFTRSSALLALHLSALYAVVEKWQKWKFVDSEVGRLLDSPFLKILKDYRHTVFHVDRYDAKGTLDMLNSPEILS